MLFAEHMADVLKVNDTLLHLNLTDNNITASGAVALGTYRIVLEETEVFF